MLVLFVNSLCLILQTVHVKKSDRSLPFICSQTYSPSPAALTCKFLCWVFDLGYEECN